MYLQLRPLGSAASDAAPVEAVVSQGKSVAIGGLEVSFLRESRFTVLHVGKHPGIPIFFAAAFLLVGGLAVTFYFPHRRVRGIVATTPSGSQATLAPLARRDWSGQRAFERLLAEIEEGLSVGAERSARSGDAEAGSWPTTARSAAGDP